MGRGKKIDKLTAFKNFYFRSTPRIFPIYYLFLITFWFLNDTSLMENAVYYFTYASNYLFYSQQFFPGKFAHLWSLVVEEQFYIFWPWLIVLMKRKFLPCLITLIIVLGVSSDYIFDKGDAWVEIITPACFDCFCNRRLTFLLVHL